MQTLVVGLDAACRSVLEPLFADGVTPRLRELFEEWSAPLESQIPPWTASAWPSLYTGRNPGKHGVFDFLAFEGDDWDIVNSSDLRARTVWEYLDRAGYTSVVVNAPVTHPPRPIDGAVVPGYLAPQSPTCHPSGLLDELRAEVGEYRVYAHGETDAVPDDQKAAEYERLTRLRGEAFTYLADRFGPAFGFLQFQKTDAVFHDFPGQMDRVRDIYRAVDETLGEVLDATQPDTVLVVSDHGIGPYDGHDVQVNEQLRRESLAVTGADEAVPSWFQIKDQRLTNEDGESDGSWLTTLAGAAGRVGITYDRVKRVLERVGLADAVGSVVPVEAVFAASEAVSFRESSAFCRSPSELGVRLNVAGRDPGGVIEPAEYDSVRERVIDVLAAIETSEGEPVFEAVVPREAHVWGPYAEKAVDVFCVPADFEHSISVHVGRLFDDPEPYNHKPTGVMAAAGDGIEPCEPDETPHIFDVAATVLATFEVAPDKLMDGSPLPVVDAPPAESYPAFDQTNRVVTDDETVVDRLSDLGYLE